MTENQELFKGSLKRQLNESIPLQQLDRNNDRKGRIETINQEALLEILESHAKGQQEQDAIMAINLLMQSRNIKILKDLVQLPTTPDHIKNFICAFFITERCFEVNGLIGSTLGSIASNYLRNIEKKAQLHDEFVMDESLNTNDKLNLKKQEPVDKDHFFEVTLPDGTTADIKIASQEDLQKVYWGENPEEYST